MLPFASPRFQPVLLQGTKDDESATRGTLQELEWHQIACVASHTVVLTREGDVHTWGCGAQSRLGHGDNADVDKPKLVMSCLSGKEVVHVACGLWHSAVIDSGGELYTWYVEKVTYGLYIPPLKDEARDSDIPFVIFCNLVDRGIMGSWGMAT